MNIKRILNAGFVCFVLLFPFAFSLSITFDYPWYLVPAAYGLILCIAFGVIDARGSYAVNLETRQNTKRNRSVFYTRWKLRHMQKRQAKSEVLF